MQLERRTSIAVVNLVNYISKSAAKKEKLHDASRQWVRPYPSKKKNQTTGQLPLEAGKVELVLGF